MSRKTIDVLALLEWANRNLKREDEFATVDFKSGICSMIEMVLLETGNYEGFSFQNNDDSATGTLGYYSRSYFYSTKMRQETQKAAQQNKDAGFYETCQAAEEEMAKEADDYNPEGEWFTKSNRGAL